MFRKVDPVILRFPGALTSKQRLAATDTSSTVKLAMLDTAVLRVTRIAPLPRDSEDTVQT
jgi:hypothetical protein